MSRKLSELPGTGTFARGLHPPQRKELSLQEPIEAVPTPQQVSVPLLQHTGSPCRPLVKTKDPVAMGDMIGEATGFISACIHASIDGTVQMASVATLPNGRHVKTIPRKATEQRLTGEPLWEDIFSDD